MSCGSSFNRNSLELALTRPITVLDNERFTVQSVITKFVCPVVLVCYSQDDMKRILFEHSLKLNCQLKAFKGNQLLSPLCSFLAGCVSARQHRSLFLRRAQPHSPVLQFLPASGKNSLGF